MNSFLGYFDDQNKYILIMLLSNITDIYNIFNQFDDKKKSNF